MPDHEDLENQHHANGHHGNGSPVANRSKTENLKRPPWRLGVIIEDFSFLWFTVSMDTGILSIILHQLPYQFHGLRTLSSILFIFNIVQFSIFFAILVLRVILYPKALIQSLSTDLTQLAMTGAVPIAWFTICAQVGLTVSTTPWGAHAFFLVAIVFWWIGTFVMLTIAVGVIIMISKLDITSTQSITPAIVIPFVGMCTDALVGGLICTYSDYINAPLAIPVIIVSYLIIGLGFFFALIIYAAYFIRLTNHGLPPTPQLPSLFLLIGPSGQTSAALQVLGHAAQVNFPRYDRGSFLTATGGSFCSTFGTLFGFFLTGLAAFFAFFAVYALCEGCVSPTKRKEMQYSLLWWGTIFPVATVDTALIQFALDLDSAAFRGLSTALYLALLVNYFVNWGFTIWDVVRGKLLSGRRLREGETEGREKGQ